MGVQDQRLVMDVFAWLLNVSVSVLIIFINKALMVTYQFSFATTICGLHFLASAFCIWLSEQAGFTQPAIVPLKESFIFAFVGSVSIASANFSLLLNSVGFYQIAKLALAPFVCVIEVFWMGKRFSGPLLLSIAAVLVGVGIVTVNDVTVNTVGLLMAIIFVVSSGLQQILCGSYQQQFGVSSHQLLSNTAPIQGVVLTILGPWVDKAVTQKALSDWEMNVPAVQMLGLSCVVAVAVNLSQFLCLGRFTATSFQVLGHAKTVLVLLGGWLLFHEVVNSKQLGGMALAVVGMMTYGYFSQHIKTVRPSATGFARQGIDEEKQALLR